MDIQKEMQQIYNKYSSKYCVLAVCLYGSQNYGFQTPASDLDVKVIIMPTLDQLVKGTAQVSESVEYEHGLIEIKDVRTFRTILMKLNPSYVEILFTPHYIVNPDLAHYWLKLRDIAKLFVAENKAKLITSMYGMALEKQKALTHKYPSTIKEIEEIGYSRKQFHHAVRLARLAVDLQTMPYSFALFSCNRHSHLLTYKTETFHIKFVKEEVEKAVVLLKSVANSTPEPTSSTIKEAVSEIINSAMIRSIERSLH